MKKLLIVDDIKMLRSSVRQIINNMAGLQIEGEAANAFEALDQLSKKEFHLILLDINLPGKSGIQLLEEITTGYPQIPVIMMSTYDEVQFVKKSLQIGARGFIRKTNLVNELGEAVETVLSGNVFICEYFRDKMEKNI